MILHVLPFLGSWHKIAILYSPDQDPLRCHAHLLHDPQQLPHVRGRIQAAETTPLQDAESDLGKDGEANLDPCSTLSHVILIWPLQKMERHWKKIRNLVKTEYVRLNTCGKGMHCYKYRYLGPSRFSMTQ